MPHSRLARAAGAVAIGLVTVLATGAAPARAGGPGDPIVGDLNGDGLPDRAELTTVTNGSTECVAAVTLATPDGGTLPPRRYTYLELPASEPNCPDLGVAVDLDATPAAELVVGWFAGRPTMVDDDLLVLAGFQVTHGFQAVYQPNFLGMADFDGDRRLDVYEWTDQGEGFVTFLNTGTGTLAPGPVRYCSGPLEYQLADFNRNGAMDVAIAYVAGCTGYFTGVVVVLDDGTTVDLRGDLDGLRTWSLQVLDANSDGIPDVSTYETTSGSRETFVGTGAGTFVRVPLAIRDYPTVSGVKATAIPVLANDFATDRARVTIWRPPQYGTVQVTTSRTIIYRPYATHGRSDSFVYRITDEGRTSNAAVSIRIVG